jgi:hypothetical protein
VGAGNVKKLSKVCFLAEVGVTNKFYDEFQFAVAKKASMHMTSSTIIPGKSNSGKIIVFPHCLACPINPWFQQGLPYNVLFGVPTW